MYQQWQEERGATVAITDSRRLSKFEQATLNLHRKFLQEDAADVMMNKLNTAQSHMMYAYRWAASAMEKEMGIESDSAKKEAEAA